MGITVATSAERMAATRARRRSGLVQFMVTMPITDRDEIARAGYEAIAGQDQRAAAEALRLFISNTVACLDVQR
jgi:hypothetical protein